MPTGWWTGRAKNWRMRSGPIFARPPACRTICRHGRSYASAVPRLRRRPSRTRCVLARSPPAKTCFLPETGLLPGCRRPSRDRCGPVTARLISSGQRASRTIKMSDQQPKTSGTMDSSTGTAGPRNPALELSIGSATRAMLDLRRPDGHWVFELEADCTIPAEYVLLRHFLGEPVDAALEAKIAVYLRRVQGAHGGWPLVHDGAFDMSASVKAYFALKMIGDSPEAPHMRRAREAIHSRGGAGRANVFTRMMLALFGFIPWRAVPVMPVEIMLLPRWFPFHIEKMSYWSRTVLVPLVVLQALKPKARN